MATNKKPKNKLADKQANEFDFKSKIEGPIAELSHLERSLLMAEISMMSYLNCLVYTSPSPRDLSTSRMPSSA